MLMHR